MKSIPSILAFVLLAAAGPIVAADHGHGEGDHAAGGHAHASPHGGTVVTVGPAHAEMVLDAEGGLHLYVLGDDESKAKPIAAKALTAQVKVAGSDKFVAVTLEPKPMDGEPKDHSSHFIGNDASLKGIASAEVVVRLDIDGKAQRASFTVKPSTGADDHGEKGHGKKDHHH